MDFLTRIGAGLIFYIGVPILVLEGLFAFNDFQDPGQIREKASAVYEQVATLVNTQVLPLLNNQSEAAEVDDAPPGSPELPTLQPHQLHGDSEAVLKVEEIKQAMTPDDDINKVPLEYADQSFSADDILADKYNRLPMDFKVPVGLKDRVHFWLDVYTKYSSHFSIIHDSERPWIIYEVVDLREIYDQKVNRFVKAANDHRAISKTMNHVRATLAKLARKKYYGNLTGDELKYYKLLEPLDGLRRKIFIKAMANVHAQRGQKDFYRKGVVTSSKYLGEMEEIFASYDLPVELVRLPLVESSFNEEAISKVGASGIWQFMLGTGKRYLKVGDIVDERNSPIKATEAAAKLMLANFRTLKDWPLAVTAYNHGAGGLLKASRKLHTKILADIIAKYKSKSFSFASQNFFSEFLAALHGEKYQNEVFGQMTKYPPLKGDIVQLRYSMRAKTLTDIVGITLEELKLYNPDFKSKAIAGGTFIPTGYHVNLPAGRKARLELFNQQADEARAIVNKLGRKTRG